MRIVDLGELGLDRGGTLLVKRALAQLAPEESLAVAGSDPALPVQLRAWCREQGHAFAEAGSGEIVLRAAGRSRGASATGHAVLDAPPQTWGLAMRGALVEPGGPRFHFPLATKDEVWSDDASKIYAQAVA